jgi:pSer/pThr/pTyr-binding forkhead associated (FHA) protein
VLAREPSPAGAPTPAPPPLQAAPPAPSSQTPVPPLYVLYAGQRYQVSKDRFIIGRGRQAVDLTIKDPNISRQHAMVEFTGGQYFIVDLGSTNGVEHNGQRITRKVVIEGDLVRICDHEVRFTYR